MTPSVSTPTGRAVLRQLGRGLVGWSIAAAGAVLLAVASWTIPLLLVLVLLATTAGATTSTSTTSTSSTTSTTLAYGRTEPAGPSYAIAGTCGGASGCCECDTSSCTGSCADSTHGWQAAIEHAANGNVILAKAGNYTPMAGKLTLPGTTARVGRYSTDEPTLLGRLELASTGTGGGTLEGWHIHDTGTTNTVKLYRTNGTRATLTMRYVEVAGGTGSGVRECGNVALTIDHALIDGGRDQNGLKALCLSAAGDCDTSPVGEPGICSYVPGLTLRQSTITRDTSFSGSWNASGEDLVTTEGGGATLIEWNTFGLNTNGENCLDVKGEGSLGLSSATIIQHNNFTGLCGVAGNSWVDVELHGNRDFPIYFLRNHVVAGVSGAGKMFVQDGASVLMARNYFDGADVRLLDHIVGNCDDGCVSRGLNTCVFDSDCGTCTGTDGCTYMGGDNYVLQNTFVGGAFKIGDNSVMDPQCPTFVDIDSNILSGTALAWDETCLTGTSDLLYNDRYNTTGDTFRACSGAATFCSVNGDCPSGTCFSEGFSTGGTLLTSDPQLTGYKISLSSPCRGMGTGIPPADIESYDPGSGYDIGCYEAR